MYILFPHKIVCWLEILVHTYILKKSFSQLYDFSAPDECPLTINYHPSKQMFACGFHNGTIRVFNVETTSLVAEHRFGFSSSILFPLSMISIIHISVPFERWLLLCVLFGHKKRNQTFRNLFLCYYKVKIPKVLS